MHTHLAIRGAKPWLRMFLLGLLLGLAPAALAATPVPVAWLPVTGGTTPSQALAAYRHGNFLSLPDGVLPAMPADNDGAWVVLQLPPVDASSHWLTLYPTPTGTVLRYDAHGLATPLGIGDGPSHGRLILPMQATEPGLVLLRFPPATALTQPIHLRVQERTEVRREDADWLAFASASLAVMLSMALMIACFAMMLRDPALGWCAAYLVATAWEQTLRSGFVFEPLGWAGLEPWMPWLHAWSPALSIAFAVPFLVRFCELPERAPWLTAPLYALAAGLPAVALLQSMPLPVLHDAGMALLHPALTLAAVVLLLAAVLSASRGSRQAWFFLLAWAPMLILQGLRNAQLDDVMQAVPWLGDLTLACGAFAALVLSLGLADRSMKTRRDRDIVRDLADHDALTRLLNRRAWTERVRQRLGQASVESAALLFLDLDNFKTLNDRLGHVAGDKALVAVADALKQELRADDLLGRYGGEEFVAILPGMDVERAMQVATRLCRRVHRLEIPVDGKQLMLSVSIGVAMRVANDTVDALVERADEAMYAAKLHGRNRVQLDARVRMPSARARVVRTAGHSR